MTCGSGPYDLPSIPIHGPYTRRAGPEPVDDRREIARMRALSAAASAACWARWVPIRWAGRQKRPRGVLETPFLTAPRVPSGHPPAEIAVLPQP